MMKGLSAAIGETGMDALHSVEAERQAKAAAKAAYQSDVGAAPMSEPVPATPPASGAGTETTGTDIQSAGTVHVMLEEDNYYERRAGMQGRIQEAQDAGESEGSLEAAPEAESAVESADSADSADSPDSGDSPDHEDHDDNN